MSERSNLRKQKNRLLQGIFTEHPWHMFLTKLHKNIILTGDIMIKLLTCFMCVFLVNAAFAKQECYKYFSDQEMQKLVGKVCLKPVKNTSPEEFILTNYSVKYRMISQTEVESLGLKFDYRLEGLVKKSVARCPCNKTSYAQKNIPDGVYQLSFNQTSEYFGAVEYGTIIIDASTTMYYVKQ